MEAQLETSVLVSRTLFGAAELLFILQLERASIETGVGRKMEAQLKTGVPVSRAAPSDQTNDLFDQRVPGPALQECESRDLSPSRRRDAGIEDLLNLHLSLEARTVPQTCSGLQRRWHAASANSP